MTNDALQATEQWFRKRGIPHFIEDYSDRRDVLTRALPLLILAAILEVLLAFNPEWPWWINVPLVAGACLTLGATWGGINLLRGRRVLALPQEVGVVELLVFLLAPAAIALLTWEDWEAAPFLVPLNALILVIVYLTLSFSLLPILRWAGWLFLRNTASVLGLFARALPLLLLIVTFLFVNAEVWSMAGTLGAERFWLVIGLFGLVTAFFVFFRLPAEIGAIEQFSNADRVAELTRGTPIERIDLAERDKRLHVPLSARQRMNAAILVLVNLSLQVLFASLLVGLFLLALGLLALDEGVIASWIAREPQVLARLNWLWGAVVTWELLQVAAFLAAFSGFHFTISVLTNGEYRDEFFEDIVGEVRQACAVRVVYLALVAQRDAVTGESAQDASEAAGLRDGGGNGQ